MAVVCLSHACLTLGQEWKGIASWKLAGRKPTTRLTKKAHDTGDSWPHLDVNCSMVKVIRPKISHILGMGRPTNFKLGRGMEYDHPHHWHARWPQRLKVKVITSRRQFDVCLFITRQTDWQPDNGHHCIMPHPMGQSWHNKKGWLSEQWHAEHIMLMLTGLNAGSQKCTIHVNFDHCSQTLPNYHLFVTGRSDQCPTSSLVGVVAALVHKSSSSSGSVMNAPLFTYTLNSKTSTSSLLD